MPIAFSRELRAHEAYRGRADQRGQRGKRPDLTGGIQRISAVLALPLDDPTLSSNSLSLAASKPRRTREGSIGFRKLATSLYHSAIACCSYRVAKTNGTPRARRASATG
jgi:hypothetical protein